MKLSTSSSFFLATLAISSSTSSLAAPAVRDAQESGLTASSFRDMAAPSIQAASRCSPHHTQPTATTPNTVAARSDVLSLAPLIDVISNLPVLGPPLSKIFSMLETLLAVGPVAQQVSPQQLADLEATIQQILHAFTSTLPPLPVQSVAGKTPVAPIIQAQVQSAATSSANSPSTTPIPSAAVNVFSASSSASPSASSVPSSPHIPANPPNTPTLPINSIFNN